MKHILLFITLLTGSFSFAYAQEDEADPVKRAQKIEALYVAYMTQQLNLNAEEAQKFWPLHKQFDTELKTVDLSTSELDRQQTVLNIKKSTRATFQKYLEPAVQMIFTEKIWNSGKNWLTDCGKYGNKIIPINALSEEIIKSLEP